MTYDADFLEAGHDVATFDCGENSLNEWLKHRAVNNQATGASRTYVRLENSRIAGYYSLSSSAVLASQATGRFRRNMPDPIPVILLGRLAVALEHQRTGLGKTLFQDAGRRIIQTAKLIGIRGMVVHALSDRARTFYLRHGLQASPFDPMMLMTTVADLKAALE